MASTRVMLRSLRMAPYTGRFLSSPAVRLDLNKRKNDTQETYQRIQKERPLNPHMTNTSSTISNEMPSVGQDSAPPEMISRVDPYFTPKDSLPSNTDTMTGKTQQSSASGVNADLQVGEMEGASFRVEPLRRTGEDVKTLKARLIYQSRKRGTLESDLLLSTFADANLATMTPDQLRAYDVFLDENDWDIYYWTTQEPPPTSHEYADGAGPALATSPAPGKIKPRSTPSTDDRKARDPAVGEWAQTVGTFKPAYRPVPKRWKNSEILAMLRSHVVSRSAGGLHMDNFTSDQGVSGAGGGGLGQMPALRSSQL